MEALAVGAPLMDRADFEQCPVGTVIGPHSGETYTRREDGSWEDSDGDDFDLSGFSLSGYNKIVSLPKGFKAKKKKVTCESLRQWQWRYRDHCYCSADQAGVQRHVVDGVMDELGLTADMFPLGSGVPITNERDKERLPDGTQMVRGEPDNLRGFGLYVKFHSEWRLLLGEMPYQHNRPYRIVTGEPPEWNQPGTEEGLQDLYNFQARAWRIGWQAKVLHRWCGSYEEYMKRIGLDSGVLRLARFEGLAVGDRINTEQAASLPEGSVLRWVRKTDPTDFTWFVRDDSATNRAKTRFVFGHRPEGVEQRNSAAVMEVLWINDGDSMLLPCPDWATVGPLLPPGTLLFGDA